MGAKRPVTARSRRRRRCELAAFERFDEVAIERPEKFGGSVTYNNYNSLATDFAEGKLHPMDAKKATATYVNKLLDPVREHFEKNENARALKEQVESFAVTR